MVVFRTAGVVVIAPPVAVTVRFKSKVFSDPVSSLKVTVPEYTPTPRVVTSTVPVKVVPDGPDEGLTWMKEL
jgi:hypothetical protein